MEGTSAEGPSSDGTAPAGRSRGLLSVVIPCLDSAGTLAVQLEALAAQEYDGPWEVVVVDDGSTDGTPDLARSYAGRLPGLQVLVPDTPRSQAAGLNAGARAAGGDRLLVLDSDDEVAPGYLRAMADALEVHPVVGGRLDEVTLNPEWTRVRTPMQQDGLTAVNDHLPIVVGAALGIRRDALEAVGGFDESSSPLIDVDLSWRLQEAGYPLAFVPDAVLRYRYRTTLRATFRQKRAYAAGDVWLAKRHRAAGAPRRRLRVGVKSWGLIALAAARARTRRDLAYVADVLGGAVGRAQGSWQHRYLYL